MAKKKRQARKPPRKPIPIDAVLGDVIDELNSVIGLLGTLPELDEASRLVQAAGGLGPKGQLPDEIAQWADVLKTDLEADSDDDLESFGPDVIHSPGAVTQAAAWRLGRVRRLLEALRPPHPASRRRLPPLPPSAS